MAGQCRAQTVEHNVNPAKSCFEECRRMEMAHETKLRIVFGRRGEQPTEETIWHQNHASCARFDRNELGTGR